MLARVYDIGGLLALLLALPLAGRLFRPRLVLPGVIYRLGAALAFCWWLLFLESGGTASFYRTGFFVFVRELYLFVAPFLLPVEAGYLAWLGLGLSSRWLLLELILAAALSPILAAFVMHLLRF
jgi:hypothetical protein